MSEAVQTRPGLLDRFADRYDRLVTRSPEWLADLRRASLERFETVGFPTRALEAWKATNPRPFAATAWTPPGDALPQPAALDGSKHVEPGAPLLVFVNGRPAPDLSRLDGLESGLHAGTLGGADGAAADLLSADLREDDAAFPQLNTALFPDGAWIRASAGVRSTAPLRILHVAYGRGAMLVSPRTLIVAEDGAELRVIETFTAIEADGYWTNAVTEIHAGHDARVDHVRVQDEADRAHHTGRLQIRQGRDSRTNAYNFELGAKLGRMDSHAVLAGEGGECNMRGLYVTRGTQHIDNHSVLDHAAAHCDSRELYKGILDGRSRTVFNGRIVVRPGAQKTDAKQSNPNLLLSEDALAQTRPQLEIYADDVKCTHGATVGRLDRDAWFYLRSRGIAKGDARNLLIRAFANEVLQTVDDPALRALLEREVEARLPS